MQFERFERFSGQHKIDEKAKIILNGPKEEAKNKRMQIASALVLVFIQLKFEQLLEMFCIF